jgi:hypothetical protein
MCSRWQLSSLKKPPQTSFSFSFFLFCHFFSHDAQWVSAKYNSPGIRGINANENENEKILKFKKNLLVCTFFPILKDWRQLSSVG